MVRDAILTIENVWSRMHASEDVLKRCVSRFAVLHPESKKLRRLGRLRNWDGKRRYFSPSGRILTGLVPELTSFLEKEKIRVDVRREPGKTPHAPEMPRSLGKFDLTEEYSYQYEVGSLALQEKRGILQLATNAGKTIIMAAMIEALGLPTIVLAGTLEILRQTTDVLRTHLKSFRPEEIGMLGGGSKDFEGKRILVSTPQSLSTAFRKKRSLGLKFPVLFIDECHHAQSNSWFQLSKQVHAEYRFGLSATALSGENYWDWRLIGTTGPVLATIDNRRLIEAGVSAVPLVVFVMSPEKGSPVRSNAYAPRFGKTLLWKMDHHRAVRSLIVNHLERNRKIVFLASRSAVKEGLKTLILCPRKKHAKILFEELVGKTNVEFCHGGTPTSIRKAAMERFRSGNLDILIGTTIYDEGVDLPTLETLIIAHGSLGERKLLQRVGRSLRRKLARNTVRIYDFIDFENKHLLKHSNARMEIYSGQGFRVVGEDGVASEWLTKNSASRARRAR